MKWFWKLWDRFLEKLDDMIDDAHGIGDYVPRCRKCGKRCFDCTCTKRPVPGGTSDGVSGSPGT